MSALDTYLSRYYSSTVIGKTEPSSLVRELRIDMAGNAEIEKEARKRLSQLEALEDGRCYISKVHKKFLREVLND